MARNEEKQLARLNRFYLQKDKEENLKKNPPRPRLENLKSASDVQKWIPSIKRDIDFCIKQSMVPCYPKSTIQEFSARIDQLKGEYKAFIRRLRELDPEKTDTPWSERPYTGHKRTTADPQPQNSSKKKDETESKKPKTTFRPLVAPILKQDVHYKSVYGYVEQPQIIYNVDPLKQDAPLDFRADIHCKEASSIGVHGGQMDTADRHSEHLSGSTLECLHHNQSASVQSSCVSSSEKRAPCVSQTEPSVSYEKSSLTGPLLNLPYSDSESDSSDSS